jgi:parallel beta-helix repeat protein
VVTDATIRGNLLRENQDVGIRISGAARVTVETNIIDRNWNSGIVTYDSETVTLRQNRVVENSRVYINGLGSFTPDAFGGIAVTDPLGPTVIANNEIRANHPGLILNTVGGVRIVKSLNVAATLSGNTIFANDGDGVSIEGNGAGIRLNNNNIAGNIGLGVNNRTNAQIDATGNWWASPSGPRAGVGTADNPEQVSGRLTVRPWAAAPVAYPVIRLTTAP